MIRSISIIVILISSIFLNLSPRFKLRLGLDLKGGTHLVYQADSDNAQAVEATKANIERRINLLGVSEPVIQTSKVGDNYRLIIELPGITDVNQAIQLIGQTAKLEFREAGEKEFIPTSLTGSDLRLAQVQFDKNPVVALEFSPEGAKKFEELTDRNMGKPLAIFLDNQIITAPVVQNIISDGRAIISGDFTIAEAKKLVIQLNAGALPVPVKLIEQRSIGATLGAKSITDSLRAAIIGFIAICIFMIANYGLKGLLADIALVVYVLVSLSIIRLIPVTLTLAGIAGLILSIGMAVDANILIFERIKEELRWGRPLKAAHQLGFHRAWNSIRDSNISSLITAAILFWFGTGSVRGFALTLSIGILVSLFSSIVITKALLDLIYRK